MHVIICGAGRVGSGIAERLAAEKNDVTVIDKSPELIEQIKDTLDVRGIVGHGAHPSVLEAAGAADADMIVAVTLFDEVNMVACQVAHSLFKVPTKIARIRAQSYLLPHYRDLFSRDHMPIDVIISPEVEVGDMVLRRIEQPGAMDIVRFVDGNIVLAAIECLEECPVVNTPLVQLTELFPDLQATVVGVSRAGSLFVPHSSDQLMVGDTAFVIMTKSQVKRTLSLFGHEESEATRIVIAGGGNIGLYVAKAIESLQSQIKVKIIENDRARAQFVADQLDRAVILNGSALDKDLLNEADVANADLMVTLTDNDQANILASVMSKRLGCKANLTLINDQAYYDFIRTLGIDAYVNPRGVTISRILQHVRRGRIRAVHSVMAGDAEVMEAEALETSPLVKAPLRDLDLNKEIRIGAISRDGVFINPTGDTQVQPGDLVIVFATRGQVHAAEQLFRVSLEFF